MSKIPFHQTSEEIKSEIKALPELTNQWEIEETAQRLERLHYAPVVSMKIGTFLRITKQGMLKEVERVLALPDAEACAMVPDQPIKCQGVKIQTLSILLYYYKILLRLREGDPEAWDSVGDLYIYD